MLLKYLQILLDFEVPVRVPAGAVWCRGSMMRERTMGAKCLIDFSRWFVPLPSQEAVISSHSDFMESSAE